MSTFANVKLKTLAKMKKDLNIVEKQVCNEKKTRIEWMRSVESPLMHEVLEMSEEQWQRYRTHIEKVLRIGREEPATCGIMVFGRKATKADVCSAGTHGNRPCCVANKK